MEPGATRDVQAPWAVRPVPTADLDAAALRAVRALCDAAFAGAPDGDFDDGDRDHCLGGLHALVHDGDVLVGHAAVVRRRVLHAGRALRTGDVEAVAVASTHRRRGVGHALVAEVERAVHAAHDGAVMVLTVTTPPGPRRAPGLRLAGRGRLVTLRGTCRRAA